MVKLGRIIETKSELLENIEQVELYLSNMQDLQMREVMVSLIGRGTNFVAYEVEGEIHFAPSRFIGYLKNTILTHLVKSNGKDGKLTSPAISAILNANQMYNQELDKAYIKYCQRIGGKAKIMKNTQRKYWLLKDTIKGKTSYQLFEGEKKQLTINQYERNPIARQRCIEANGCKCKVCGIDFEEKYGEIGHGFIHVHHVIPISTIGETYQVDPINDLVPVCPNCHAMLHRGFNDKILTIEELRTLIQNKVHERL